MADEIINIASFDLETSRLQKSLDVLIDKKLELTKVDKDYSNQIKLNQKEIDTLTKLNGGLIDESSKYYEKVQELNKENNTTYKLQKRNAIQLSAVRSEYNATAKQIQANIDIEGKQLSLTELGNKALQANVTTRLSARKSNQELNRLAEQLNPNIAEEAKLLDLVNKKLDSNNKFIKENGDQNLKRVYGIGEYTEGIKEAIKDTDIFGSSINSLGAAAAPVKIGFQQIKSSVSEVKDAFNNMRETQTAAKEATLAYEVAQSSATAATERAVVVGFQYNTGLATETELEIANTEATKANATAATAQAAAQTAVTSATSATSVALKVLRVALISAGIGAIVVVLGSLIAFLTSTQAGIDKVTSVTRPLIAVFQSLLGVAQVLGEKLFNAFSNPKKLLTDLVDFIKGQVINRFQALGIILDGIVNLDFDKIKNGFIQGASGVEDLTGKIKKAGQETAAFFKEAAARGAEIDRLTKEIERDQLNYNRQLEKTNDLIDEQKLKAKDTSLNIKEREKAANEIIRLTKELGKQEESIIQKKIQQLKIQQSLNDTSREGEQEMIDLEAQLNSAQDRGVDAEIEQLKVISAARKEAAAQQLANVKKAQDSALLSMKVQLDTYIENQGERKLSMEDELKFAEVVKNKSIAIAREEYKQKKLTKEQFDLEILKINNDFLKRQTDLTIENAQLELDELLFAHQRKIDQNTFFNEELYQQEVERLQKIRDAEAAHQSLLLESGKINQLEYNAAIRQIDEENRVAQAEATTEREEAQKEKEAADFAIKMEANASAFDTSLELQLEQFDIESQQRREAAEKAGADMLAFEQNEARKRTEIEKIVQNNKVQLASQAFGNIASILGEASAAGKAAAIAQTTIDTYQSATAAYKSMSGIPVVGPALGAVAAGAAVVSGLANVKKILSVDTKTKDVKKAPGYALGGVINSGVSIDRPNGDNVLIAAKLGEVMLNDSQQRSIGYANLSAAGVQGLSSSGNISVQNSLESNVNAAQMANIIADAVMIGAERGSAKGSSDGIERLSSNRQIMENAKF